MREIKFRAWDKENNKMIEWNNLHLETDKDGLFIWIGDDENDNFGSAWGTSCFELMQYTGLKDKNGKEIYEGDIVKVYMRDYEFDGFEKDYPKVELGVVEYSDLGSFEIKKTDGSYSRMIIDAKLTGDDIWFYILGNIYENPELLEDNKCK